MSDEELAEQLEQEIKEAEDRVAFWEEQARVRSAESKVQRIVEGYRSQLHDLIEAREVFRDA